MGDVSCWLITTKITTSREGYATTESILSAVAVSVADDSDPIHSLIGEGARLSIAAAVEAELDSLLKAHQDRRDDQGRRAVVRNGYLPRRIIHTGVGDIRVQAPKVSDRSGSGVKFNSSLLPPDLKRAKNLDELIPWQYLRGGVNGRPSGCPAGAGRRSGQGFVGEHDRALEGALAGRVQRLAAEEPESEALSLPEMPYTRFGLYPNRAKL